MSWILPTEATPSSLDDTSVGSYSANNNPSIFVVEAEIIRIEYFYDNIGFTAIKYHTHDPAIVYEMVDPNNSNAYLIGPDEFTLTSSFGGY